MALARMPRPPAFAVALTRRGPETQPMPVCTTGCRTPTRSVRAVRISCSRIGRHLPVAQAPGVEHLADQDPLLDGGLAGRRHVGVGPSTTSSKPVAARTSATLAPGWTLSSRTVESGPPTSSTARSVTIRWMSLNRAAAGPASRARAGPTPETTSTRSTRTRGEWRGTQ